MADLSYEVNIRGVEDLQALANGVEKVTGVLTAAKGSGKALEELRKVLVGIKGSSSVLHELRDAINQLNGASDRMGAGITKGIKSMEKALTSELKTLQAQVNNLGAEMAKGYTKNYEEGIKKGTAGIVSEVKSQGKTIAAAARAQATAAYQNMVGQNPNAKLTQKGLAALFDMKEAGAQISNYHSNMLKVWKAEQASAVAIIKADAVRTASSMASAVSAAAKAATLGAQGSYSSLRSGRLVSIRNEQLDMVFPSKAEWQAALDKRVQDLTFAAKGAKAQVSAALANPTGSFSNSKTGSLVQVRNAALDMVFPSKTEWQTALAQRAEDIARIAGFAKAQVSAALTNPMGSWSNVKTGALVQVRNAQLDMVFPSKAEWQAALDARAAQLVAVAKQSRAQMNAAMMGAEASYSRYSPKSGIGGEVVKPVSPKALENANKLSSALKTLTKDMGDTHSMARGLASGFNLLWLTWGNLAPLFIGAAISNGFMQTAKQGMEVAHSLQTIASLGMGSANTMTQTAQAVSVLSTELIRLGNEGIYGPVQAAEAMQVLALAGLKANEVLAVTGTVLNLATAGTTDIKTAADVLVSITTAFGTGAAGFRQASDIMVRAAADSKASIESIGEAMKTASVVGEQYGASIGDVGTMIALLANLGIQGSAAGTAIRNMFVDMSERTPKVAKIMKQFGLEFRDATTGGMKPLLENIQELDKVLRTLDAVSGKNLLQAIFSERGGKAAIASLAEYRKAVVDADGVTQKWSKSNNGLTKQLEAIANAAGDAAIAAAEMSQSTLNSFKAVGATMQTSMFQAFQAMEPQLYLLSVRMREAFSDPTVVAGLTSMVKLVADLGVFLADNAKMLGIFLGAWAGGKVLSMIGKSVAGLALNLFNIRTVLVGSITAVKSWGAAATALGGSVGVAGAAFTEGGGALALWGTRLLALGRLIPGVGTVLTLLTGAMFVYNRLMDDGTTAANTWSLKSDEVVKKMQDEITELDKINALRMQGLSTLEAEIRLKDESARASAFSEGYAAVAKASSKSNEAAGAYANAVNEERLGTKATGGAFGAQRQGPRIAEAKAALEKALAEENVIRGKLLQAEKDYDGKKKELQSKAAYDQRMRDQERLEELRRQQAAMNEILGSGTKKWSIADEEGGGSRRDRGDTETARAMAMLKSLKDENKLLLDQGAIVKELSAAEKALTAAEEKLVQAKDARTRSDLQGAVAVYQSAVAQDKSNEALKRKLEMDATASKESSKRIADIYKEIDAYTERNTLLAAQNALPFGAESGDAATAIENENLLKKAANLRLIAEGETDLYNKEVLLAEAQANTDLVTQRLTTNVLTLDSARRSVAEAMAQEQFMLNGNISMIGMENDARQDALIDLKYEYDLRRQLASIDAKEKSGLINTETARQGRTQAIISNANQKALEKANKAAKSLQEYLDPKNMKKFGNEAGSAFKKLLNPLQNIAEAMKDYGKRMEEIAAVRAQAGDDPVKLAKAEDMALQAQLGTVGNLAGAMSGFFDEGSKGYKILQAASQAFFLAQQVAAVASMMTTVATEPVKQAAFTATAAAASMTLPPPFSFAALAATVAALASFGVAMSGGGGGGGGAQGYTGIAKGGTGTVMGMEGEQSKSLANSIEILADNSKIELTYTQKMLSEMTKMREGIQGLAGTASQDFFIRGFAGEAFGDSFLDSGIGFFPGQTVADIIEKGVQGMGFNLIFDKGAQAMWKSLDETFTKGVGSILGNVAEVVFTAADALGLNDAGLAQRMLSLIPTLGDTSTYQQNGMMGMTGGGLVSFKDMSGKEIQEELEAIFSAVGDQMVAAAFPMLKPFQRIGEGMFETLTRLTSGIESANYELEKFGFTAIHYTDIIRKNGDVGAEIIRQTLMNVEAEMAMYRYGGAGTVVSGATPTTGVSDILDMFEGSADEFIELYNALNDVRKQMKNIGADFLMLSAVMVRGAGGLENLQSGLDSYFENFFSEEEQLAAKTARLAEEFVRVNVAMPTSIESFRALVESIDLSTEAGQYLFGQLIPLSDAFYEVFSAVENYDSLYRSLKNVNTETSALTDVMLKASGGAEALESGLSAYFENFFSEEERLAAKTARLAEDFAKLGLSLPTSNQEFRRLVESLDLSTSSGQSLYGSLIPLSDAFYEVFSAVENYDSLYRSLKNVNTETSALTDVMLKASGGAEALESGLSAYFENFFSEEERLAAKTARLAEDFAKLGLSLPTSNQEFRRLVESLDLSTSSGQSLYGSLIVLSGAFAEVYANSENLGDSLKTMAETLNDVLGVAGQYLTPGKSKAMAATRISETLANSGIDISPEAVLGYTRQQVADIMSDLVNAGDLKNIQLLLSLSDDFLSITESTVDSLNNQKSSVESVVASLKTFGSQLEAIKDRATNLSRSISNTLGEDTGRESQLWEIVRGAGDLDSRLKAAEELKSLVEEIDTTITDKYRTELASAEELLDFAKSLKAYVESLKVGDLSALTPAEKMAEAARQYTTTLQKAVTGDQDALSNLQSVADTYLSTAKEYSPDAYGPIFNSVVSQLENLSASLSSQYTPEVERLNSLLAASDLNNKLNQDQISKLTELNTWVNAIYSDASSQAIKNSESLAIQMRELAAVETLLAAAQDPFTYLPKQYEALESIDLAMQQAHLIWTSAPAQIAATLAPVIGLARPAEEQTNVLLEAALERLQKLEESIQSTAIMTSTVFEAVGQKLVDVTYEVQDLRSRSENASNSANIK